MSIADDRTRPGATHWRGGIVIAAAALVFAILAVIGTLPVSYAVVGFAVVAAAAVPALRSSAERGRFAEPIVSVQPGDDLLRILIAGLPDPVLALDRDGRVLALNDRARALAPALRQGEPVSPNSACSRRASGSGCIRPFCNRWIQWSTQPNGTTRPPLLNPSRNSATRAQNAKTLP